MVNKEAENSAIEIIMEKLGNTGFYQKRFYIMFLLVSPILAAMPYMNQILSLATPNHWCHVPGRENTNYTREEWKNLTIPNELDVKGLPSYSKCKRYANWTAINTKITSENKTVKCEQGWDYDHTWYDMTAPMQHNWVCDDEMVPANIISMGFVGEVVGTLLFGLGADIYGRMPTYFITLLTVITGRVMFSLTSSWTSAALLFSFVGSLSSIFGIEGPLVIATEISRVEDRALIGMVVCCTWNLGLSIIPLIFWWLRDWTKFILATTLPCAIFLFSRPWMIESPRWLASKGHIKRCMTELKKIAKTNKTEMPEDAEELLTQLYKVSKQEKHRSVFGLFSSLRLAKNCAMIVTSWSIVVQIYMSLTINVTNLDGNPFLNYLFQSLAELPAFVIGKIISDRYGRRYTSVLSFSLTFMSCISIVFVINDISNALVVRALCIFTKFSVMLAYYSLSVQSLEIYPTCIRQTGPAIGTIVASGFGTVAPYIIALGVSVNAILPFAIYSTCSLIGVLCALCLPETNGHNLPETFADAASFGADQDFWGRSKRRKENFYDDASTPLSLLTQKSRLEPIHSNLPERFKSEK